jgi:hypothetical protein
VLARFFVALLVKSPDQLLEYSAHCMVVEAWMAWQGGLGVLGVFIRLGLRIISEINRVADLSPCDTCMTLTAETTGLQYKRQNQGKD